MSGVFGLVIGDAMQLYVLKKQSQLLDNSTSCVFSNVEGRLVSRAQSWLPEVAPARETRAHAAEDSSETIAAFMEKNMDWIFQMGYHVQVLGTQATMLGLSCRRVCVRLDIGRVGGGYAGGAKGQEAPPRVERCLLDTASPSGMVDAEGDLGS